MEGKNAIITNFWCSANYGALLTAYALQNILKNIGINSILINDIDNPYKYVLNKYSFMIDFANKYLNYKNGFCSLYDIEVFAKDYNLFITGSDQVFRVGKVKNFFRYNEYLLNFANINSKKIAFSASFAVNKQQFCKETSAPKIEQMKSSLTSFDFISVREKSGVEICKDIFNIDAKWIIDPVFLIDVSYYNKLIMSAKNQYKNKIVTYILDKNKKYKQNYKYLFKKYGKEIVETAHTNISVEDWLASIRDCELLITDSFHGMCFAIIFNKPFICIANKSRGNARFDSICEMLKIRNQCVDSINDATNKDCIFQINYEEVNHQIDVERQRGLDFLKQAVEAPIQKTSEKINSKITYLENCVNILQEQNNLNYQLKIYLWEKWKYIYYKILPKSLREILGSLKNLLMKGN